MKLNSFTDRVIVITGASSGLGKLTVEELIRQGSKVVLAARSEDDMREHVQSLRLGEDTALVVKTDVSDHAQVEALAQAAIRHFGKIDIWINNAAINLYGYTEEVDINDIRRVIDVNLMGPIYGMKVVLPIFVSQGFGTIINVGAVESIVSFPLQAAYDAAKHGLLGFSSALREELLTRRYQGKQIDVVDILPPSLDTPFNLHAKNITDSVLKPLSPIFDPMLAVQAIIQNAKEPQPIVLLSPTGKLITIGARWMPVLIERLLSRIGLPQTIGRQSEWQGSNDNMYHEMKGGNVIRGGFDTLGESVQRSIQRHPVKISVMGMLPMAVILTWLIQKRVHHSIH